MERPHPVVPDRLIRDNRRDAWILILPASDFLNGDVLCDVTPALGWSRSFSAVRQESQSQAVSAGLMERVLPFIMLTWAFVVWAFLFYELGHL